jgi:AraC-like DNA-binding protein
MPSTRYMLASAEQALATLLTRALAENAIWTDGFVDDLLRALNAVRQRLQGPFAAGSNGSSRGLAPWQLRLTMGLVCSERDLHVALRSAAIACDVTPSHLSRSFKKSTGLTLSRWRMEQRVQAAQKMLEESDVSLADIADRCGFADQSHFTNVFSKLCKESPGAWRRRAFEGTHLARLEQSRHSELSGLAFGVLTSPSPVDR